MLYEVSDWPDYAFLGLFCALVGYALWDTSREIRALGPSPSEAATPAGAKYRAYAMATLIAEAAVMVICVGVLLLVPLTGRVMWICFLVSVVHSISFRLRRHFRERARYFPTS